MARAGAVVLQFVLVVAVVWVGFEVGMEALREYRKRQWARGWWVELLVVQGVLRRGR